MDTLWQDIRFAFRTLVKSPGFTGIAVLSMALGIGANTTIFSAVNGMLLRPAPYTDPERIVALHETQRANHIDHGNLSYLDYRDLAEAKGPFQSIAAFTGISLTLGGGEEPERIAGEASTASLFPLLGIKPILGRIFTADEDRPGAPDVVVLSHSLWMRRFHGDPAVLGTTMLVNQKPHTIVGVMPERFAFPEIQEAWVPLVPYRATDPRSDRDLDALARLAPGVGEESARAEMDTVAVRWEKLYPDTHTGWRMEVRPLRDEMVGKDGQLMMLTLQGAVGFVLLIACANVANLLLARASGRRREIAVRLAFGAARGRIVRQLLTESVLVALVGAAFGLLLASWGNHMITASVPQQAHMPFWMRFTIDGKVLLFTVLVAVATGVLFGLVPALQAARADLASTLKEGGRGAGGSLRGNRLRSGLVVAEVALSLVLLIGSALFARSFLGLLRASGGFATAELITFRLYMPGEAYEPVEPKTRRMADVVRRLEAVPGIVAASASNNIPLAAGGGDGTILAEGHDVPHGQEPSIFYTGVTPHFRRTLGVSLLGGRDFTEQEGLTRSAVALVNQAFVRKVWPKDGALGRRFRLQDEKDTRWLTVIGVVPDIHNGHVNADVGPAAYLPYPYYATHNTGIVLRTRLSPEEVLPHIRREVHASDPSMPIFEVTSMEELRRVGFWEQRLFAGLFVVFGVVAFCLAGVGVYGVLSYSVGQRLREIGVRVALGATRWDVIRLIVGQGLRLALVGISLGLLGALAVTRLIGSVLYGVSPTDPLSFAAISLVLAGAAFLASYLPAQHALELDPLAVLRQE